MVKADPALKEVWRWKDEVYEETKRLSMREFVRFAHKRALVYRKKCHIQLTELEKDTRRR